jgi:hypothetical protein
LGIFWFQKLGAVVQPSTPVFLAEGLLSSDVPDANIRFLDVQHSSGCRFPDS